MDKETNRRRLLRLVHLIEEESPNDGIHNREVQSLNGCGEALKDGLDEIAAGSSEVNTADLLRVVLEEEEKECPQYLACTSEGTGESSHRDNPDFFAGDLKEVCEWLASSYQEGWAANWISNLDNGKGVDWTTFVQAPRTTSTPFYIDTLALMGAANDTVIKWKENDAVIEVVEAVAEVVNQALGREPDELDRTKVLIGAKRPAKERS